MIKSILSSFDYHILSPACMFVSLCICACKCCRIVADWQPKYWIDYNEGQTMFVIDTSTGTKLCRVAIAILFPILIYTRFISIESACSPADFLSRDYLHI